MSDYSEFRLSILRLLHEQRLAIGDLHRALGGDINDLSAVLKNMAADGLITLSGDAYRASSITRKGREALLNMEQKVKEHAKEESQQRFENKLSVATLLVSAVSFLLGILVEHFAGICRLISQVFH